MVLTKVQIINSISDQIGYPKNHSVEIVESLLEIIDKIIYLHELRPGPCSGQNHI